MREDSTIVQPWKADHEAGRTLTIIRRENTPLLRLRPAILENKDTMAELDIACVFNSDHILLRMICMQKVVAAKKKKQISYEEGDSTDILISLRLTLGGLLATCSASHGSLSAANEGQQTLGDNVDSFDRHYKREMGSFRWSHGKSLNYYTT